MRALLLIGLLVVSLPAAAVAEPSSRAEARRVSVDLKDRPFRQAVEQVFSGSGAVLKVHPEVPNVAVTLSVKDVPLETAARLILHVAAVGVPGLQLTRVGDGYVYAVGGGLNPDPTLRTEKDERLDPKVTLELPEATLRGALAELLGKAEIPYVVLPNVPNVPLRLKVTDAPRRDALAVLMQQAHAVLPTLYLGQEGPAYVIGFSRAGLPGAAPAAASPFAGGARGNLNLRDIGLRACLRIMTRGTEYEIEADPKLPDPKLTFNFKDVTLEDALKEIAAELGRRGTKARVTRKGNRFSLEPGGESA